ncbi:MAG: cytochrome c [Myxococcaceae bacterium]|nr:cytochrome c [Myxococcaceae bacterium]
MRSLLVVVSAVAATGCIGKYIRPTSEEKFEATPERLERGRYVVESLAGCGACHTPRPDGNLTAAEDGERALGGGNLLQDGPITVYIPNLTNDAETGLGGWTDDQVARAIRDGITKDEKVLFPVMPYTSYQLMSDEDVKAVVAYLRSLPPQKPVLPRRENELPFFLKRVVNAGATLHAPAVNVAAPAAGDAVARGKYVAHLGHCTECHNFGGKGARDESDRYMAGSDGAFEVKGVGKVWAPNLTSDPETGIARYSDDQLKAVLRTGKRLDGKLLAPPMSLMVPHFATMTEQDASDLVAWLRTLPPVKQQAPPRELDPAFAKLLGE